MKSICIYKANKYSSAPYVKVSSEIYKNEGKYYVTLSFKQEPDLGEGKNPRDISQYPLEDILDKYSVFVSDSFKELNIADGDTCYLEFSSRELDSLNSLLEIVGKHVYDRILKDEKGHEYAELVIE